MSVSGKEAPEPMFHTLTMKSGPLAKDLEVYLDGFRLKGVRSMQWTANLHDAITVTLEMIVETGPSQHNAVELAATSDVLTLHPSEIEPWKPVADLPPHMLLIQDDLMKMMEDNHDGGDSV